MIHHLLSKAISKRGDAMELNREFVVFFNFKYKNIYLEETYGLMTRLKSEIILYASSWVFKLEKDNINPLKSLRSI